MGTGDWVRAMDGGSRNGAATERPLNVRPMSRPSGRSIYAVVAGRSRGSSASAVSWYSAWSAASDKPSP